MRWTKSLRAFTLEYCQEEGQRVADRNQRPVLIYRYLDGYGYVMARRDGGCTVRAEVVATVQPEKKGSKRYA